MSGATSVRDKRASPVGATVRGVTGKKKYDDGHPMAEGICAQCDEPFVGRMKWDTHYGKWRKPSWCNACTADAVLARYHGKTLPRKHATCGHCGSDITHRPSRARYCNINCRRAFHADAARANSPTVQKLRKEIPGAWCTRGQHEFTAVVYWQEKTQRWGSRSWCNACTARDSSMRFRGITPPPQPKQFTHCTECGKPLPENRGVRRKFCDKVCREKAGKEAYAARERERWLRTKYNLRPGQYDAMVAEQGGVCASCGEPPEQGKFLTVDHDHACCDFAGSCGKCIRQLLCRRCNIVLGLVNDNVELLHNVVAYVARHQQQLKLTAMSSI